MLVDASESHASFCLQCVIHVFFKYVLCATFEMCMCYRFVCVVFLDVLQACICCVHACVIGLYVGVLVCVRGLCVLYACVFFILVCCTCACFVLVCVVSLYVLCASMCGALNLWWYDVL